MGKSAMEQIAETMLEIDFTDSDKLDAIEKILNEEGY